jgi:copper chaperone NosL
MERRFPPNKLSWLLRGLIAVAALATLLSFFFPLWHYYFEAPQYPEGLAMSIWSYKLGGRVDLINGLNHYVGFMELESADFVEFKVLPALVILTALTGLFAAALGSLRAVGMWVLGFTIFGIVAFIDFYRWLYTFGHTTDPMAIIEIEGYTPPMFGSSEFMNFYIVSYPGLAFYSLIASLVLGIVVWTFAWWYRRPKLARQHLQTKSAALRTGL